MRFLPHPTLPGCALFGSAALVLAGTFLSAATVVQEWKSGIPWSEPKVIDPGTPDQPPSDAIVLFNGSDLSAFDGGDAWKLVDGYAEIAGNGGLTTKQSFGDCQIHLEWAAPEKVQGSGQGRGNSGVYLMGKYEVQILDSYQNDTYYDGQCGSIYKQYPPLVNACRPPGEWQTYDIIFNAPRFTDAGAVESPAMLTVLHNGVVIQNHVTLQGGTFWHRPPEYEPHAASLPIHIQNHGNPLRFRNIWIRNIDRLPAQDDDTDGIADAAQPANI